MSRPVPGKSRYRTSGQKQDGRTAAAAFTTFYNLSPWLDTTPPAGLYSLALVKVNEPLGEA